MQNIDDYQINVKCPVEADNGTYLITGDITSLYTNITTEKGKEAIAYFYDKFPTLLPNRFTKTFILELFTFCQEHLYFSFEDISYRLISGTGMGRIYAPAAADIKVGYQEIETVDDFISSTLSINTAHLYLILD